MSKLDTFLARSCERLPPALVAQLQSLDDANSAIAAADEHCRDPREYAVCWFVFRALARHRVPIEERWEVLLPEGTKDTAKEFLACVDALAPERRVPAFLKANAKRLPSEAIFSGITFLTKYPEPHVVAAVEAASKRSEVPARAVVKKMRAAALKKHGGRATATTKPTKATKATMATKRAAGKRR